MSGKTVLVDAFVEPSHLVRCLFEYIELHDDLDVLEKVVDATILELEDWDIEYPQISRIKEKLRGVK